MKVLVTGSNGLIGSEAVEYYDRQGHEVIGVDNNMRAEFFGAQGDTTWNLQRLSAKTRNFKPHSIDIRDRDRLFELFQIHAFDLIIHCAAQPSHDKACQIPILDFEVNALGTMNLLEATRQYCPEAVFIHMSTNKVYGDAPNELPRVELEKRYDYANEADYHGISEDCRIDRTLHSLFGASKTAADIVAQEYGRYFGMNVGIFRGGCLTGPSHSGVELHGFLSYLIKVAVTGGTYRVFGYKGKQVRDNIHSYDVIQAFEAFRRNPRPGEVYNLGGGRENSISILETFDLVEQLTGRTVNWVYVEQNRIGDHICYISDLRKLKSHFPEWQITRSITDILQEIVTAEDTRYASVR
ncbi:NAD-dependent epimerase/dehydratase [Leptolyngbya boryana NIES-2135]|jgi:CDP-paratose 2-epimerase|uniref:NAD-dependent epimerase/dehydratase n=1 Tax=Leptolyngbya boryana NIES-2135 TaxID=1973484 RepID=A0A1Z4JBL4_LEPBY|nr:MULTISPECIES: NAD-dependent epimerase/dehydratase family protein [Leptolyngbya]BAY54078.1 NAD-dependent epimerase/dehydratase [Leptolyngbya boryana NIES-2135]MBD2369735.1 NAD-dependent epimerase/dehydratase family protein [Leptolyngbya sp. FACHB-161]MBD2376064.1 NAD-dependent epimerase/dehydratase family protein [Leptolyngbya sp. FACHB-238]MBD2400340.1 NAD-dependent epimerase/dehydratase family protein [Leptolyngbya sp. FACHB-239]MBD2406881.1 NAD-dependent epimerase/dehydratase family prote